MLQQVFIDKGPADDVLQVAFQENRIWGSRDRRFVSETFYEMIRWWGRLIAIDGGVVAPEDEVDYFIRWGSYHFWKTAEAPWEFLMEKKAINKIPEFHVVDESKLPTWQALSVSPWLLEKFTESLGDQAISILSSMNDPGWVYLRINTLKGAESGMVQSLLEKHELSRDEFGFIRAPRGTKVMAFDEYVRGEIEIQDPGSQQVAKLVNPEGDDIIVDYCAGAGGKTLHMAALLNNCGKILASDIYSGKLARLKERMQRAGASNIQTIVQSELLENYKKKAGIVLVDAPCTGSGILRRKPGSKWQIDQEKLSELVALQREILIQSATLLRGGGRLIYSTCSLLKDENENQVNWFLEKFPKVKKGQTIQSNPLQDWDGIFAQELLF